MLASDVRRIVDESLIAAQAALGKMHLEERTVKVAKSMLSLAPGFSQLQLGSAASVWAACLFMDLRGSTTRALEIGATKTYLTMHALIPAMTYIANQRGGHIVGFRGDGLFAAFGLSADGRNPAPLDKARVIQDAAMCGQLMIDAVKQVINTALWVRSIPPLPAIGIGIDAGDLLITRIGLDSAFDITAYGDAVNSASKLCAASANQVAVSAIVDRLYPSAPAGLVKSNPLPGYPSFHHLAFPGPLLE